MAADKPLTEKRLVQILKEFQFVSQKDLAESENRLVEQIVESNKNIISTVEKLHNEVIDRLDNLELNTVKRSEFDALKRKVERYQPTN